MGTCEDSWIQPLDSSRAKPLVGGHLQLLGAGISMFVLSLASPLVLRRTLSLGPKNRWNEKPMKMPWASWFRKGGTKPNRDSKTRELLT